MASESEQPLVLGWREMVSLKELGIPWLRAKVDTGAKTSSLNAIDLEYYTDAEGREHVRFVVQVGKKTYQCESPLYEKRVVKSSNGESTNRPVIETTCRARGLTWPIELTLADRSLMKYPMLLGREALAERFLVDSGQSYLGGKPKRRSNGKGQS